MTRVMGGILVAVMLAILLGGCSDGLPEGAAREMSAGTLKVEALNAGLMAVNAYNVTYKMKCSICGTETEAVTIPTPPPGGRPYKTDWLCPKCSHKELIQIKASNL